MGNKRRRIALSCVDCRRRKVKCDRTYPSCVRCQKGGYGDQCTYVTHTSDPNPNTLPTPEDEELHRRGRETSWAEEATEWEATARSANAPQQQPSIATATPQASGPPRPTARPPDPRYAQLYGKVKELESLVYSNSNERYFNFKPATRTTEDPELAAIGDSYMSSKSDKALLRGRSFRTKYYGASHSLSTLLQFEELSRFIKDMLVSMPHLTTAKLAMQKLRDQSKRGEKATYDLSVESLRSMIPERSFTDRLLSQYLESFETTYRVLHVPSFLKDYEAFWKSPKETSQEFVVQLLLVMASVYCIVPGGQEGYLGRSSVRRETAGHWVNVCQHWLDNHSQKHIDLPYFQVHVLLWVARRMNCLKIKRDWTIIGNVSRLMINTGFHREPTLISNRINSFDCEMRRRLWYTVLELDLQCALDRGMSPTISSSDWDTFPPRNIDDESFDIESNELPESKPRDHFTRTAFLSVLSESLPQRVDAVQKINSIRAPMEFDTIMVYDDRFRKIQDELPVEEWKEPAERGTNTMPTPATASSTTHVSSHAPRSHFAAPSPVIASALAQLIFLEYIAVLHQPIAMLAPATHRNFFSRAARRYACMSCLNIYVRTLDDSRCRVFAQLRQDELRAILAISHDLTMDTRFQENRLAVDMIQDTVHALGNCVAALGQGFHSYWIVSSALSFVHAKQSPQVPSKTFAHAAIDRIMKLHDTLINEQLPQARQLMAAEPNGGGLTASQRQNSNAESAFNLPNSVAADRGSQMEHVSPMDNSRSFVNQNSLSQGLTGLSPNVGQAMDLLGSFDQTDPFASNSMLGIEGEFDWSNIWTIDPFSAWQMGSAAGPGGPVEGAEGYFSNNMTG